MGSRHRRRRSRPCCPRRRVGPVAADGRLRIRHPRRLGSLALAGRPLGVNEWRPRTWRETLASPCDLPLPADISPADLLPVQDRARKELSLMMGNVLPEGGRTAAAGRQSRDSWPRPAGGGLPPISGIGPHSRRHRPGLPSPRNSLTTSAPLPYPQAMASSKRQPQVAPGPWGWENSKAKLKGKRQLGTIEIGCYTDLPYRRMDPVQAGLCTVLMPLSLREFELRPKVPRLGVVLRVEQYLGEYPDEYVDPTWEQLDPKNYHGAVAWEELAGLISLTLGLRLRAGGILRVFGPDIDELGHPHEMDPPPYLPGPARYWPILPGMSDDLREIDSSWPSSMAWGTASARRC